VLIVKPKELAEPFAAPWREVGQFSNPIAVDVDLDRANRPR